MEQIPPFAKPVHPIFGWIVEKKVSKELKKIKETKNKFGLRRKFPKWTMFTSDQCLFGQVGAVSHIIVSSYDLVTDVISFTIV